MGFEVFGCSVRCCSLVVAGNLIRWINYTVWQILHISVKCKKCICYVFLFSYLLPPQNVSVLENHHWRSTIGMLRESRLLAHLPKEMT